jgi:hypothetical protein
MAETTLEPDGLAPSKRPLYAMFFVPAFKRLEDSAKSV